MPKCVSAKLAAERQHHQRHAWQCTPGTRPAPASDGTHRGRRARRPAKPACPAPAAARCRTAKACNKPRCPAPPRRWPPAPACPTMMVSTTPCSHPAQLAQDNRNRQRHHGAQFVPPVGWCGNSLRAHPSTLPGRNAGISRPSLGPQGTTIATPRVAELAAKKLLGRTQPFAALFCGLPTTGCPNW